MTILMNDAGKHLKQLHSSEFKIVLWKDQILFWIKHFRWCMAEFIENSRTREFWWESTSIFLAPPWETIFYFSILSRIWKEIFLGLVLKPECQKFSSCIDVGDWIGENLILVSGLKKCFSLNSDVWECLFSNGDLVVSLPNFWICIF